MPTLQNCLPEDNCCPCGAAVDPWEAPVPQVPGPVPLASPQRSPVPAGAAAGRSPGQHHRPRRRAGPPRDRRLRREAPAARAALEAGADPVLVTGWITGTQAHRAASQARLSPTSRPQRLTRDQITSIVSSMRDLIAVLASVDVGQQSRHIRAARPRTDLPSSRTESRSEGKTCADIRKKVSEGGLEHESRCDLPGSGKSCN
jgi:hypothetical protein